MSYCQVISIKLKDLVTIFITGPINNTFDFYKRADDCGVCLSKEFLTNRSQSAITEYNPSRWFCFT